MQRYQHPGVIRNYPFDSLVVGNSFVGNLQTELFNRKEFELGRVQNLAFWSSSLREAAHVVDYAVRTKPINTVYWSIGRQAILQEFRYNEFPTCMYSRFWSYFPYCYLLNADIFSESLAIALNRKGLSEAGWVSSLEQWKAVPFQPYSRQALACEIQRAVKGDDVAALTRDRPGNSESARRTRDQAISRTRAADRSGQPAGSLQVLFHAFPALAVLVQRRQARRGRLSRPNLRWSIP